MQRYEDQMNTRRSLLATHIINHGVDAVASHRLTHLLSPHIFGTRMQNLFDSCISDVPQSYLHSRVHTIRADHVLLERDMASQLYCGK